MASSSSSSAGGGGGDDGPSTTGGRSERPQYWDFVHPTTITIYYKSKKDLALQELLHAVMSLDIVRARKWAEKLKEMGTGLDEAVAALANRKSKRHGPLHVAASTNLVTMCKMLIKDFNCDPNAVDADDATPLFFAILGEGSQAVVKYLITSGADPKKANNRGVTPLHCAARRGYCEIADHLLSKGVDVDPICYNGEAPLHVAAFHGHAKMVELLLQHNANLNRLSDDLHTPLVASLFGSSLECLKTFIQARADINTSSPVTPLSVAAREGLADCIKCLLNNNADPNEPDEDGKLPVQIAASRGRPECVRILLPITDLSEKYATPPSVREMLLQESTERQEEVNRAVADGDDAYWEKNYAHALKCYTKALRLGYVGDLHAKRGLCHLKNYDGHRFLDDAISYMDGRRLDFSIPPEEEAKKLVLEYSKTWKAPASSSGCNPTDETDETSREEDP
ncbi:unnamed protein product [Urochloa humidicola]